MKASQIPVLITAFLGHLKPDCAGEWQVSKVPHPRPPEAPRLTRVVLSCEGCAAGHVYDVRHVPPGEALDDIRPQLRVVRS